MKTMNHQWIISVSMLLAVGTGSALAVSSDVGGLCWRDGAATTRQVWTFNTSANPAGPISNLNPHGTPSADITKGPLAYGYYDTTCAAGLGGCGDPVTAVLPLNPPSGEGPPYESIQFGFGEPYDDPPYAGTAQGFWEVQAASGGGKVVLTIPNNGAPAGTLRFFLIQGVYWVESSIAAAPTTTGIGATNSLNVGTATRTGSALTTDPVEQPLDAAGDLTPGRWMSQRVLLRIPAATAAGNDTVTINGPSPSMWLDSVIVETLDRVAQNDAVSTPRNTVTNIPFATLLANDRGSTSIVGVGGAANGTVATNAGNVVTFTPMADFTGTASFWYTNRDCMGTNLAAQVTVDVTAPANQPPVLTNSPTTYVRAPNITLKIRIADLLANNAYDPEGGPVGLAAVSSQSTNSSILNVWTNATHIFYTNSANVADSFTYTVADTNGATAVGIVLITINMNVTSQAAAITITNSTVLVTFAGVPNYPYEAQRATNTSFTGTLRLWPTNAPANGVFQVTDDFSDIGGQPSEAYYRLRYAP